eukprot:SAG22_NODE_487_length_9870_cov_13.118821_13_plen_106_part_00
MADPAVEEKMRELRATVDSVHRIFQEKDIRFGKMKDEETQKLREAQELWDEQRKAEESALEQKEMELAQQISALLPLSIGLFNLSFKVPGLSTRRFTDLRTSVAT